jgi:hypothetical protein
MRSRGRVNKFQAMGQQNRIQRQGGGCVFVSQSGGFAGGGVGKTPAGDYSINTHVSFSGVPSSYIPQILCLDPSGAGSIR